jgi:hypothetical protein
MVSWNAYFHCLNSEKTTWHHNWFNVFEPIHVLGILFPYFQDSLRYGFPDVSYFYDLKYTVDDCEWFWKDINVNVLSKPSKDKCQGQLRQFWQ